MRKKTINTIPFTTSKIHIGIDPGKDGGIFIQTDKIYTFFKMPLIGKEYDSRTLFQIFNSNIDPFSDVHCVVEDVHAILGSAAKATFNFGFGCGLIEGILVSCGIPFTKVQPKQWQKQMFEGVPTQTKMSGTGKTIQTDTKKMAEIAAKRLFPEIDLRLTENCKNSHDGKVDALLICEYCSRNF